MPDTPPQTSEQPAQVTPESAIETLNNFMAAVKKFSTALKEGRDFSNTPIMRKVMKDLTVLIENILPELRKSADGFRLGGNEEACDRITAMCNELEDDHLKVLMDYLNSGKTEEAQAQAQAPTPETPENALKADKNQNGGK